MGNLAIGRAGEQDPLQRLVKELRVNLRQLVVLSDRLDLDAQEHIALEEVESLLEAGRTLALHLRQRSSDRFQALNHVFARLDNFSDLASASAVCRTWRRSLQQILVHLGRLDGLLSPGSTIRSINLCIPSESMRDSVKRRIAEAIFTLSRMPASLEGYPSDCYNGPLPELGTAKCRDLSHIFETDLSAADSQLLRALLCFPRIHLRADFKADQHAGIKIWFLKRELKVLDFKAGNSLGSQEISKLQDFVQHTLTQLTGLDRLGIRNYHTNNLHHDGRPLPPVTVTTLSALTSLHLWSVCLPRRFWKSLSCLTNLEAIKLVHVDLLVEEGGEEEQLTNDELRRRERLLEESGSAFWPLNHRRNLQESVISFRFLEDLPRLDTLYLNSMFQFFLYPLIGRLAQLRELMVTGIDDRNLRHFSNLTNLTRLRVDNCAPIAMFVGMPTVPTGLSFPWLKSLHLYGGTATLRDILALPSNLPSLSSLTFEPGPYDVEPQRLTLLSSLDSLTALSLCHARPAATKALGQRTGLRVLSLQRCRAPYQQPRYADSSPVPEDFTGAWARQLVMSFPLLEEVTLHRYRLRKGSLRAFGPLEQLRRVVVSRGMWEECEGELPPTARLEIAEDTTLTEEESII